MIQNACECNFDIPGVEKLPPHDHNSAQYAETMARLNPDDPRVAEHVERLPLRDSVRIWVDWKAVAKGMSIRPTANGRVCP